MPNSLDLFLELQMRQQNIRARECNKLMAYKSQVTNKYMGSSFAGRVNPERMNLHN